jgi:ferric-dicitrate binding protein FerR (iron transport regulator)
MSSNVPPASPKRQLAKMREGRQRAERQRRREAIARVRAYEAWLKAGSVLRRIPAIPSDADYRTARGQVRR